MSQEIAPDLYPPIADGLFRQGPTPVLLGGYHRDTGAYAFPMPEGLGAEGFEACDLGSTGKLWTWTIQRFRPKSPPYAGPEAFEPFAVGYVNVGGKILVESRLVNIPFDALRSGMTLRLTLQPFEKNGSPVLIFAFEPDEGRDD